MDVEGKDGMSAKGGISNWGEFIQQAYEAVRESRDYPGSLAFHPPASEGSIANIESALGVAFPSELRSLLAETNGITELIEIEGEKIVTGHFIWTIERIKRENLEYRTRSVFKETFMPFDCLLFFADSGCGDNFGFAVVNGQVRRPRIYAWEHEDDSRVCVAPSLADFIKWSLAGKIKL